MKKIEDLKVLKEQFKTVCKESEGNQKDLWKIYGAAKAFSDRAAKKRNPLGRDTPNSKVAFDSIADTAMKFVDVYALSASKKELARQRNMGAKMKAFHGAGIVGLSTPEPTSDPGPTSSVRRPSR